MFQRHQERNKRNRRGFVGQEYQPSQGCYIFSIMIEFRWVFNRFKIENKVRVYDDVSSAYKKLNCLIDLYVYK